MSDWHKHATFDRGDCTYTLFEWCGEELEEGDLEEPSVTWPAVKVWRDLDGEVERVETGEFDGLTFQPSDVDPPRPLHADLEPHIPGSGD